MICAICREAGRQQTFLEQQHGRQLTTEELAPVDEQHAQCQGCTCQHRTNNPRPFVGDVPSD